MAHTTHWNTHVHTVYGGDTGHTHTHAHAHAHAGLRSR